MNIHVVHDQNGRIVGAAEVGPKGAGDKPVPKPGMSVAELEVPKEFANKKASEFLHLLHVDVGARKLVSKR
jgi:hypothetical protein